MKARPAIALPTLALVVAGGLVRAATADPVRQPAPTGLAATVAARSVALSWDPVTFPPTATLDHVVVSRDGAVVATLPPRVSSWDDTSVAPAHTYSYTVTAQAARGPHDLSSAPSAPVAVALPAYLVGAATEDITPGGPTNLGGFGLGDGTVIPSAITGRGGFWQGPVPTDPDPLIRTRAVVFDDGKNAVAIASIETQGMFAAYDDGPFGLHDMAVQVAHDIPGLPVGHIVIASDHTHHGPDTIGAWGGVSTAYLAHVRDQTVKAIETAYLQRRFATVRAGQSDASDLIYNQACSEALNQDKQPTYTGPDLCATPGKDGMMRVLRATAPSGEIVMTLVVYAAHSTTNIGPGPGQRQAGDTRGPMDGDWPQFLGDRIAAADGGVGIGMEGANGGTQPCRPSCAFTRPSEPGYSVDSRFEAVMLNYGAHADDALHNRSTFTVTGPVAAAQRFVREPITGPFVNALFLAGKHTSTRLMRASSAPWMDAQTVRTVVADVRVGSLLFDATPGEGFAAIRQGVEDAVHGPAMVIQLGLANDQLGYLIAPTSYVPVIAAEAAVNDNILFNVSPTIGDHVMCADIDLATRLGADWSVATPPQCQPFDAEDLANEAAGDPLGSVPGVPAP